MNVFRDFSGIIDSSLQAMIAEGQVPADLDRSRVTIEPPRDAAHGDLATNAAMVLARPAGMKPRDLAEGLAERLRAQAFVTDVDVAGPGFINLRLSNDYWIGVIPEILAQGVNFGNSDIGADTGINVEYVSANPTGPMHVGHARGACVGDALARLLARAGFNVTREYLINDAGAQVDVLARSLHLRYREALGEEIGEIPHGLYPGEYLKDAAAALVEADGDKWQGLPEAQWLEPLRSFAVDQMMAMIREDLALLNIHFNVFTSEAEIFGSGAVDRALAGLEQEGLVYTGILEPPKGKTPEDWEPREQLLFRASAFGDDTDRPLKKSDGSNTYFCNDIAYHYDKFTRSGPLMVDVMGADHGGYVKRMKAAVQAMTGGRGTLDILLTQMVKLTDNGEPVKMSKRAGTFVTLRDVVEAVGPDVVRFIMLTRKSDQMLEFDYAKVREQSRDNPVFYVQYAHARCRSVLRNAADAFTGVDLGREALSRVDVTPLKRAEEIDLIKRLAAFPRILEQAAEAREPHRIAFYLNDVASDFHGFWTKGREDPSLRFIIEDDMALSIARLALVEAVATVIASGLDILGVTPVDEMH